MPSPRWIVSRPGMAGLLAGLALACAVGSGRLPSLRAAATPPAEATGTLAFTSGVPGQAQWLYLIDTKAQAFAVYSINPQDPKGAVKLEAARQYKWDLKLAEYNNQPPEVRTIQESMAGPVK
jgi:hypothetical protein